jgi:hypothetical protein
VAARTVRAMIIDCDTCTMRDVACAECVVTFLTFPVRPREPAPAVARAELSDAEGRALSVLARSGLVPPLRMTHRVG